MLCFISIPISSASSDSPTSDSALIEYYTCVLQIKFSLCQGEGVSASGKFKYVSRINWLFDREKGGKDREVMGSRPSRVSP